jgi:exopolysaccharide production protein ExoY
VGFLPLTLVENLAKMVSRWRTDNVYRVWMPTYRQSLDQQRSGSGAIPSAHSAPLPTWKRVLDLTFILAASPVLAILSAGVALLVKWGSPGPVLFRQQRVGHKGHEFTCYKFRTMRVGAAVSPHRDHFRQLMEHEVPMTKLDARRDPRLVPLGTVLRATGLDELPQVINILRGEMSLVGPRPCIPYEYEAYQPWQRKRFDAVPGLTGLWQVSGKNRTTFNEMIRLDIEYSERMGLCLDLKILLKTVPAVWQQYLDSRASKTRRGRAASTGVVRPAQSYH